MSSKILIDRKQLETAANRLSDLGQTRLSEPLFALILAAPVVERQPVAYEKPNSSNYYGHSNSYIDWKYSKDTMALVEHLESVIDAVPDGPLYTAPPELAELQATIERLTAENKDLLQTSVKEEVFDVVCKERDQLKAEIERLKGGQGEPVCPACNGSGEGWVLSDASPDAHNIQVDCQECNGRGSLLGAYESMKTQLNSLVDRYVKAGGELFFMRSNNERLAAALKFYADRDHYSTDDGLNWDNCSGEPSNILWHEEQPWFIEDGTVARSALNTPRPSHANAPADSGTHPHNDGLDDYRGSKK